MFNPLSLACSCITLYCDLIRLVLYFKNISLSALSGSTSARYSNDSSVYSLGELSAKKAEISGTPVPGIILARQGDGTGLEKMAGYPANRNCISGTSYLSPSTFYETNIVVDCTAFGIHNKIYKSSVNNSLWNCLDYRAHFNKQTLYRIISYLAPNPGKQNISEWLTSYQTTRIGHRLAAGLLSQSHPAPRSSALWSLTTSSPAGWQCVTASRVASVQCSSCWPCGGSTDQGSVGFVPDHSPDPSSAARAPYCSSCSAGPWTPVADRPYSKFWLQTFSNTFPLQEMLTKAVTKKNFFWWLYAVTTY